MRYFIIETNLPTGHTALTVNDRITLLDTVSDDYTVNIDILSKAEGELLIPDWQSPVVPIVTPKVAQVIRDLKIPQTQVLNTFSRNTELAEHEFFVIHSNNAIDVIDYDKSVLKKTESTGVIRTIDKLVIDQKKLEAIDELAARYFFLPNEPSVIIVDEITKDAIERIQSTGITFITPGDFKLEF